MLLSILEACKNMPEQVTITKEIIEQYPYNNAGIFDKMFVIRCSLCMPPNRNMHRRFHVLREGDIAVKVTFKNGTVGYYGLQCWQDPNNADRVARILKQELKPKIQQPQKVS